MSSEKPHYSEELRSNEILFHDWLERADSPGLGEENHHI